MGFKCGIVGLPNVGKSTIFNALTAAEAASENFPFCTIDPNVGAVPIPDARLDRIQSLITTQKVIPAAMEFVDIAGLVEGASKGEGLGNQFLGHIRQTDAICHVVRCFEDKDVVHVSATVDPIRDIGTIDTELILADHETVQKAATRYSKLTKSGNKVAVQICAMLEKLGDHLQGLNPARTFSPSLVDEIDEVRHAFRDLHLITAKKVLYLCNVGEDLSDSENGYVKNVREHAEKEGAPVVVLSGKIECEIASLPDDEKLEFAQSLGIEEPGLNQLIRAGYDLLGLQTYFTAGEKEIRAWTIPKNAKAPQAAGKIHTDFERGFICAEVHTIADLETAGSKAKLKEQGLIRKEGREYQMVDGDIVEFRFNV